MWYGVWMNQSSNAPAAHLVYFNNFKYSPSVSHVRTYKDLKTYMSESAQTTVGFDESLSTFSISSYFYSPQNYKQEMSLSSTVPLRRRDSLTSSSSSSSSTMLNNFLYMKDCSNLLPVSSDMARGYK